MFGSLGSKKQRGEGRGVVGAAADVAWLTAIRAIVTHTKFLATACGSSRSFIHQHGSPVHLMPPPTISHLTLPPLRKVCQHLGIPSGSTKHWLIEALSCVSPPKPNTTTLSIDLGIRNLAFCLLAPDNTVQIWDRVSLNLTDGTAVPKIHLPTYAEAANAIKDSLPVAEETIIEHQRWRSGGGHGVLPITIAVNTIEAMLHVLFMGTATSVEAATVAKAWGLVGGKDRKKEKVGIVKKLLMQRVLTGELDAWGKNKKKDDLADCLIQALTWKRWMLNRERWVEGKWPLGLEFLGENLGRKEEMKRLEKAASAFFTSAVITSETDQPGNSVRLVDSPDDGLQQAFIQVVQGVHEARELLNKESPLVIAPRKRGQPREFLLQETTPILEPVPSTELPVATIVSERTESARTTEAKTDRQIQISATSKPLKVAEPTMPKKIGMPRKVPATDLELSPKSGALPESATLRAEVLSTESTLPKKRGRPRKVPVTDLKLSPKSGALPEAAPLRAEVLSTEATLPKKIGRPRKVPVTDLELSPKSGALPEAAPLRAEVLPTEATLPKKRGRPRKVLATNVESITVTIP